MFSARIMTNVSTNVKNVTYDATLVIIHFKGLHNVYAFVCFFFQGENSPVKVFWLQLASYVLASSM